MPATLESQDRTRAFARVMGPFLAIVPGVVVVRAHDLGKILSAFFKNEAIVWMMGAPLFFCGLPIIAFHQFWRSPTAVTISLFGWFPAIRGLILLATPKLILKCATASVQMIPERTMQAISGAITLMHFDDIQFCEVIYETCFIIVDGTDCAPCDGGRTQNV